MTLEEAKNVAIGDILYHIYNRNVDNTPQRWKVNGMVKRWKRDKDRIKIPIKFGLFTFDYIENDSLHLVEVSDENL